MAEDSISSIIQKINPKYKEPVEDHTIVYDSSSETLEPVYFWIVDYMSGQFEEIEKLVDNFSSSPGSGHFAEMGARATKMQEEAMKIMQTAGVLIKSLINILYDLREFEIRLSHYKDTKSKEKEKAEAGLLALKQIWMDNVDMKRGTGSINALASGQLQFVTLRDAFMVAKDVEDVDKIDLNDRVKRILKPRIAEFLEWKNRSEKELTNRYEIERIYLKNQVNSLKMYSRWAKPYLKAASELEMKEMGRSPALVKAFNTLVLQLTLLGKKKISLRSVVEEKRMPKEFFYKELKRKYYACVVVDFNFRGIPQKIGQHFAFGGRVEVSIKGYALNDDELALLNSELDKSDLKTALKLVEGMTTESLGQLEEEINRYLKEEKEKKEEKKSSEDTNPFTALFSFAKKEGGEKGKGKEEKGKTFEIGKIKKDDYLESFARKIAEEDARKLCFNIFDLYKKTHEMASHPDPFIYWNVP